MHWRVFVEGGKIGMFFYAKDAASLTHYLLLSLNEITKQREGWEENSMIELQVRYPHDRVETVARLPLLMEMAVGALNEEALFSLWCEEMFDKARRGEGEPPAGGGEATVEAKRPPAFDGKPDSAGCGGKGCGDPTCAYCCDEDFADEEDVKGR